MYSLIRYVMLHNFVIIRIKIEIVNTVVSHPQYLQVLRHLYIFDTIYEIQILSF